MSKPVKSGIEWTGDVEEGDVFQVGNLKFRAVLGSDKNCDGCIFKDEEEIDGYGCMDAPDCFSPIPEYKLECIEDYIFVHWNEEE
jgi:hypothetical protein